MATAPLQLSDAARRDIAAVAHAGFRGARFAITTRVPYALVLALLYGHGPLWTRAQYVVQSSRKHALHLALAAALYRLGLVLLRRARHRPSRRIDPMISGLVAGWVAFGQRDFINEQIMLYSLGRLLVTVLARDTVSAGHPGTKAIPIEAGQFRALAALVTGFGLWAAVNVPQRLPPGMLQSLRVVYL